MEKVFAKRRTQFYIFDQGEERFTGIAFDFLVWVMQMFLFFGMSSKMTYLRSDYVSLIFCFLFLLRLGGFFKCQTDSCVWKKGSCFEALSFLCKNTDESFVLLCRIGFLYLEYEGGNIKAVFCSQQSLYCRNLIVNLIYISANYTVIFCLIEEGGRERFYFIF